MKNITTIFIGDSITEGQYVSEDLCWTALVGARIRNLLSSDISDKLVFFHRGVSGETTRQGLERFPRDVQDASPQVVSLQFGLNDCNCWDTDKGLNRVSKAAFHANLSEMIDRGRACGAKQIILSTNHRTLRHKRLANNKTLEQNRAQYNKIIYNVSNEMDVPLCDVGMEFNQFSDGELAEYLLPTPDLIHLSRQGHEYYANLILPFILEAIKNCINTQR